MTVTSASAPATRHRAGRTRRTALVVLAVGQLVSSVLSQLAGSEFQTADRPGEPAIVPPGGAFAIWGLVIALSVGWAVWAMWAVWAGPAHRPDAALRDRLAVPLLVVFAGFSVWLVAAALEPIWTTLVVFAVMLAGLVRALAIATEHRAVIARWSPLGRGLLWGTLGVYAGWSTVAIWINLTTALAGSGAPVDGPVGVVGQLAVLAGATATAVVLLRRTGGLLPYAAAVAWALGGAVLGAAGAGQPVLAAAAALGLLVVAGATVRSRRRPTDARGPRR